MIFKDNKQRIMLVVDQDYYPLIFEYKKRRKELDVKIDRALAKIEGMLGIKIDEV